jgi:hypothetical protein
MSPLYFLLLPPLHIKGSKTDLKLMTHETTVIKTSNEIGRNYFEIERQILIRLTQFSDYTKRYFNKRNR